MSHKQDECLGKRGGGANALVAEDLHVKRRSPVDVAGVIAAYTMASACQVDASRDNTSASITTLQRLQRLPACVRDNRHYD